MLQVIEIVGIVAIESSSPCLVGGRVEECELGLNGPKLDPFWVKAGVQKVLSCERIPPDLED
jgi:hypothetical protein